MEVKREGSKGVDFLHPREFRYFKVNGGFSKALVIIVQIAALYVEIFAFVNGGLHFSRDTSDASRLPSPGTSSVYQSIRLV